MKGVFGCIAGGPSVLTADAGSRRFRANPPTTPPEYRFLEDDSESPSNRSSIMAIF
jgi:hypothetical protein